jgi:TonB family protein
MLALGFFSYGQEPAAPVATPSPPATAEKTPATPAATPTATPETPQSPGLPANAAPEATPAAPQAQPPTAKKPAENFQGGGMTEEELKQMLVGKALYLRGGYLENSLNFDEHGKLIGHSPQGSYTLSAIQIDHAHLSKRKVELTGARYGLHFLGQLAFEDPSSALDRVRITPKKKFVKITIDREQVVLPKKKKEVKPVKEKNKKGKSAVAAGAQPAAAPETAQATPAVLPVVEAPAERGGAITVSPAHTTKVLKEALDQIFAQGLDERMMAAMPDFWKLYYEAVAAKADYRPKDPSIYRQNTVDQKAVLLSKFEPDSTEFAQQCAVAGMAQYHAVVGPDGKVTEVAISRPIGFGLDENAVDAIRKAHFQPAMKDGKPVAVMLNLDVPFRIFSKRTNVHSDPEAVSKPAEPIMPGPYSAARP